MRCMKNSSGNLRASPKSSILLRWLLAPIFPRLAPKFQQKLLPLLSAVCSTQRNTSSKQVLVPAGNLFALGKSIKFLKTRTHRLPY